MNSLPLELNYEIALNTSGEDLVSLCSSFSSFSQICSDPYFWRTKFKLDEIPLLFQAQSEEGWINLYLSSLQTMSLVTKNLEELGRGKKRFLVFNIGRLSSISFLFTLPVNRPSLEEAWERLRRVYLLRQEFSSGSISREEFERLSSPRYSGVIRISRRGENYEVTITISKPGQRLEEYSVILNFDETRRLLFIIYFYLDESV